MNNNKDVYVIMPFSDTTTCKESQWTDIFKNVFRRAFKECGYSCERAMPSTGNLITSIVESLRTSRIVLADVTDRNPNVFYELGVRHSLSKRTIIVAQGSEHIPSDLRGYWWSLYGTQPGEVLAFKKEVKRLIAAIEDKPDKSDSPVSDYLERENISVSTYVQKENVKKLTALYTEFSENIMQLRGLPDNKSFLYVSHDCLGLLLQSLYVDIGPKLLSIAYVLNSQLRCIESGQRDRRLIRQAIDGLRLLSTEILAIKNKLLIGQFAEPAAISTMVWATQDSRSGPGCIVHEE